ncbi:hypothetical protein IX27_19775 [Streptomyces sp. JS01]|uniref:Lipoprotein signal peptidase n=1 Tax=Streptomyces nanshensis TaxID=518642 RepID=A0A1E7LSB7_9ACTN|nr:lipoprotein signal peptidase [Streptomyces parvus]KFK88115.1 hypothetical protein IX27_19775 [Streptomyces sp. JS01]OEV19099.1 hypothetical protein AN221_19450 [Streptomyces nanshensis]GGS40320.1 lipoprotein signal peptidase [Streptomyces parvus]
MLVPRTTPSTTPSVQRRFRGHARAAALLVLAAVFAVADLAIKAWAQRTLPDAPIEGDVLDLRLAFNSGVAFSFASDAPTWLVLTVTGLITTAIAVALWRTAHTERLLWGLCLAAILGGAAANLTDRAADGLVTDYLHSGWWPTFNLADVFIVLGGIACVALSFGRSDQADA